MKNNLITPKADIVNSRQIALAGACLLPAARLLETPSILAKYASGDLLLPALLQFFLQGGLLFALLFACSRSEKTLFERLEMLFGKWSAVVYIALSIYYLFSAILPLFDLEKFTYAIFFDTAPTSFSFLFFFFLSCCRANLGSVIHSAKSVYIGSSSQHPRCAGELSSPRGALGSIGCPCNEYIETGL